MRTLKAFEMWMWNGRERVIWMECETNEEILQIQRNEDP